MIGMSEVRFSYPQGGFGLEISELRVAAGERVCWVGTSGSGKTTLLHLAAGIFTPDSGTVSCCGRELSSMSDSSRRDFRIANIGLVFQDFALVDYLSVLDNILLPYRINGSQRLNQNATSRASRLASDVGLGDMLTRRPSQLSQGERQRVAACRAIVAEPKLLLADEPTANLDADNSARVLDLLEGYATEQQATCIIVTHDPQAMKRFEKTSDVSEFCQRFQPQAVEGNAHA